MTEEDFKNLTYVRVTFANGVEFKIPERDSISVDERGTVTYKLLNGSTGYAPKSAIYTWQLSTPESRKNDQLIASALIDEHIEGELEAFDSDEH